MFAPPIFLKDKEEEKDQECEEEEEEKEEWNLLMVPRAKEEKELKDSEREQKP